MISNLKLNWTKQRNGKPSLCIKACHCFQLFPSQPIERIFKDCFTTIRNINVYCKPFFFFCFGSTKQMKTFFSVVITVIITTAKTITETQNGYIEIHVNEKWFFWHFKIEQLDEHKEESKTQIHMNTNPNKIYIFFIFTKSSIRSTAKLKCVEILWTNQPTTTQ